MQRAALERSRRASIQDAIRGQSLAVVLTAIFWLVEGFKKLALRWRSLPVLAVKIRRRHAPPPPHPDEKLRRRMNLTNRGDFVAASPIRSIKPVRLGHVACVASPRRPDPFSL